MVKVRKRRGRVVFECRSCGSSNCYSLKDGTRVCRRCGFRFVKRGC